MDTLAKLIKDHWGDLASVAGVLISIVGFAVTIASVVRSKKAAQRAEEAVRDVRESILKANTVVELSAATTIMEEIKRLHRASAWVVLLDRYSTLKRLLISIRAANLHLPDVYLSALQSTIQHFTDIERKVERSIAAGNNPPNVASLNEIVSEQADKINELLAVIRQEIGGEKYGRSKTSTISQRAEQKND